MSSGLETNTRTLRRQKRLIAASVTLGTFLGIFGVSSIAQALLDPSWITTGKAVSSQSLKATLVDLQSQIDTLRTQATPGFTHFEYYNNNSTANFAYQVPPGITSVFVEISGGGGGGGGGDYQTLQAHTGGQGGWGEVRAGFVTVDSSNHITISVGQGGSAGAESGQGGLGGDTTVLGGAGSMIAKGGIGGRTYYPGDGGSGGQGGKQLSSRRGFSGLGYAISNVTGQEDFVAQCSTAPGEGGCGGDMFASPANRPGRTGQDGYVKIWY